MQWSKWLLVSAMVGLASCGTYKSNPNDETSTYYQKNLLKAASMDAKASNKASNQQLNESAQSVSQSMNELAMLQKAKEPDANIPAEPAKATADMSQLVTIKWTGPVEPLISKIADAVDYRLRVMGKQGTIPLLVSVQADHKPIIDVVRDVKYQLAGRAEVSLYPDQKIIELRYPAQ